MPNKIIYDINGKIKEVAESHMSASDDGSSLFLNKLSFESGSVNLPNGILSVGSDKKITVLSGTSPGQIVSWDSVNNKWKVGGDTAIDLTSTVIPANQDISGTFGNATVRNVSNVSSGTLSVSRGGTGLSSTDFSSLTNEAILIGNGSGKPTLVTASSVSGYNQILTANSSGNGWTTTAQQKTTGSVQVDIYTTPGTYTWNVPGARFVRILAQGAGGGGGAGANRSSGVSAIGGGAGGAGGFIDTGIILAPSGSSEVKVGGRGLGGYIVPVGGITPPSLLMHFDTLTCSVDPNRSVSFSGDAQLTSSSKFGPTSLYCGTNAATAPTINNAVAFGANEFTIEFWIYPNTTGSHSGGIGERMVVLDTRNNSNTADRYAIYTATSGRIGFYVGGQANWNALSNTALNIQQWNHVAFTRTGNTINIFINGVKDTVTGLGTVSGISFSNTPIVIGGDAWASNAARLDGFLDELAIFEYAKYTGSFTTASAAYGADYEKPPPRGLAGAASSFGTTAVANGGNFGSAGLLNTVAVAVGGASVSYGSSTVVDSMFYNSQLITDSGNAGVASTTTVGSNNTITLSGYYNVGGGASGGSLAASNYTTNYAGGNASVSNPNNGTTSSLNAGNAVIQVSTFNSSLYIATGGGGGASYSGSLSPGDIGGRGGNGAWGSGGGGGGASTNYTGSAVQNGGNGGDGYVAVISYIG